MKYANRKFDSVDEMDEVLIRNWNATVGEEDLIYHLGDVSLTREDKTLSVLSRLNGNKYLILGNHEKSVMKKSYNREMFDTIRDMAELKIDDTEVKGGKQSIVLCHYAMRVWNKSHHGAIHLYGHSHDSLDNHGEYWGKSMDVGVDSAYRILGEYRPFSYDEIKDILSKRDVNEVDHHVNNRNK